VFLVVHPHHHSNLHLAQPVLLHFALEQPMMIIEDMQLALTCLEQYSLL
jgi:hypothetical protein